MLLSKKRYVGFKFESPTETTPAFDAKGIETVRRDGCGAVSKMLERSIKSVACASPRPLPPGPLPDTRALPLRAGGNGM